jgi:hypothetical protein
MKKQTIVKTIFASSILSASCIALAANSATATITANVTAVASISMTNTTINFLSVDPTQTSTQAGNLTNICVYTNNSSGKYVVSAKSDNATKTTGATQYMLQNTSGNPINYTVYWFNTGTPSGSGTTINYGSPITSSGADTKSVTCSTKGSTASLQVVLDPTTLAAASPGTYSDSLTITVGPSTT